MKKDMFDCLEESVNTRDEIYLIKTIKNKRNKGNRPIFLSGIVPLLGQLIWSAEKGKAKKIIPGTTNYEIIRSIVRERKIWCKAYRISPLMKKVEEHKPVRKEKWWDRIKVWFSRKVQYFAGYISIERPMKD